MHLCVKNVEKHENELKEEDVKKNAKWRKTTKFNRIKEKLK